VFVKFYNNRVRVGLLNMKINQEISSKQEFRSTERYAATLLDGNNCHERRGYRESSEYSCLVSMMQNKIVI